MVCCCKSYCTSTCLCSCKHCSICKPWKSCYSCKKCCSCSCYESPNSCDKKLEMAGLPTIEPFPMTWNRKPRHPNAPLDPYVMDFDPSGSNSSCSGSSKSSGRTFGSKHSKSRRSGGKCGVELRASVLYANCECGKRNGLQDDCRKSHHCHNKHSGRSRCSGHGAGQWKTVKLTPNDRCFEVKEVDCQEIDRMNLNNSSIPPCKPLVNQKENEEAVLPKNPLGKLQPALLIMDE